MNMFKKHIAVAMVLVTGTLACGVASATAISMNFDQFNAYGELVGSYYGATGCAAQWTGNTSGPGNSTPAATCGGPNYGIEWSGAVAGNAPNGAFSNTSNEPSGDGVMGIVDTTHAFMDVAAGFTNSITFWYSLANPNFSTGNIEIFSGLDGTGSSLGSVTLNNAANFCNPGYAFSCWHQVTLNFSGTAMSVNFAGTGGQIVFDNIQLETITTPEPAVLGMFGLGLLLLGGFVTLRRRQSQKI